MVSGASMPEQAATAEAVVLCAMSGDAVALRRVWQEHRRWIAAVLLAHKPAGAELDDLLQDVAVSMLSNISTLRDAAKVRPWLRMIAVNAARAAARRQHPVERLSPNGHFTSPDSGGDLRVMQQEDSGRILQLAMSLPQSYGEPLLLQAVRGLTVNQIADILELPATTIETRLARARRMLREQASSQDSFDGGAGHRQVGSMTATKDTS
jgi:RNA polymerase sigma-70 factor (ECF subfamily)